MRKLFIISFIILILDVISKRLVINLMLEDESFSVIDNFFSITYAKNTGVAFSFLDGYVGFIILMTVIVIFIIFSYIKDSMKNIVDEVGYGFIIGGAIGNLLDRVIYGYVVDFLDFNIFGYNYPIFNLADTFIVVGVFLLIINSFKENGDENEVNSRKKCKN